jgi:hypothetical protein
MLDVEQRAIRKPIEPIDAPLSRKLELLLQRFSDDVGQTEYARDREAAPSQ